LATPTYFPEINVISPKKKSDIIDRYFEINTTCQPRVLESRKDDNPEKRKKT
jgi:hypothetical protein